MRDIDSVMRLAPVMPVLVIEDIADAKPIAEALVAGGLNVLEVTLRTPCALEAIKIMKEVPGAVVGAGTVLNAKMLDQAQEAGCEFFVSPGLTADLGKHAVAQKAALLPGVANAADVMLGLDLGLDRFKFFPAENIGGLPALKSMASVFRQVRFCPTGGITPTSAPKYLENPSILCVGGSWVVPAGKPDVAKITALAKEASAFKRAAVA
ncbi:2-dehydro-3-deoxyphosphogluconate aldolase/4-hydroxy-2-oxoglutarate aldolase [Zymomonas mobilis subsp. mobilis ZM4 = ATCC 31821]|uniref:2-dehydro-3-deoxy-phosphogluconate aldolase n=4 Tax=Zymomonas mobilis TaxID=542 RepID=ALKD_ZYMMO|nr:bifunctional 4-hydroxy-2-oxoglutarate aldolase/2-dehydro-3-deoxy-phosphogluconate aldolase [Zymomonas mobilis]Q00384.2 RecName: Full=KHG/KDPG aldolase; Includes: RecName: Full=4-hydroxy-2-oxoglutarate aldolase; AltName: Full=2-keto-4-hydroxyglutarate aldolase; Short=KHG-aldolase; Includes: RecName: Full=2-dehydro-3-deoxy-phosphogluconate aldolase; AltName: Full=2-keto-3-deoxy-6-phosphogluconate aldolase; Short=KDPG-aldolase; AltName: Full=Phospho-2-dehydro-3-deoxygluconate aldolase; AltName: Fu